MLEVTLLSWSRATELVETQNTEGTPTRSCHQPHGSKQESLPNSPDTYLEKLQTRWHFLSKTWARFLLSSLFIFKLLNPFLPLCGQCGGTAAKQEKGPACWPRRAPRHAAVPPKPSLAILYTRGVSCGKAEWRPVSPGTEESRDQVDVGITAIGRMLRTFKPLEY